jgi:hypothetical protein
MRANGALLLATLSWGLSLTTADAALADLTAADLLLLETASGTVVVALTCLLTGRRLRGAWRPAFALGARSSPASPTCWPTSAWP